jgi:glycosyltransferase involved in cell wall biosynthesis
MAWGGPGEGWKDIRHAAGVLLGHPDQFRPLLHWGGGGDPGGTAPPDEQTAGFDPLFLWAQLSRPVGFRGGSSAETHPQGHAGDERGGRAGTAGVSFAPPPGVEAARLFGRAIPVPLTSATAEFLAVSGFARVRDPIPHGVDTTIFRPLARKAREDLREDAGVKGRFVVGTVGAFTRRKRFDKILDAFALFAASRRDAHLLVKTDRIRSLEGDDLARMAGERGVSDRVTFATDDPEEEGMARLYSLMDVYINLSEWEGFCIPVIEAMASGVPVIAQPGQGPGEIVPYRELLVEGGELVEERGTVLSRASPERAALRLREAAEDPGTMRVLSERGRGEAEARYDIELVAEKWLALIGSVADP